MAKKSKSNFGFKNFLFSFVAVIIAIYVFQSKSSTADIMVVEKGTLENIIEAKGIVVKDEKVYTSTVDGSITFHQEEGAKVNQGLLIEDINSSSKNEKSYSQRAGILSYKIDGLENVYTFDNILNMMPSDTVLNEYTVTDMKQVSSIKSGDSLYKIIRNFNYYMAVTLSNDYAKLMEEKKYIKVRVVSGDSSNDIWGYIEKINYGSDQSTIIFYFDDFFNVIYDKRYVDLKLITDLHEGLKIEKKSLVEKEGIKGVYVKDASNIVKFMPVKILGEDENTAVVSEGSYVSEKQRNTIVINDKNYETIKIYDNIILRPDKVIEGQIVD